MNLSAEFNATTGLSFIIFIWSAGIIGSLLFSHPKLADFIIVSST